MVSYAACRRFDSSQRYQGEPETYSQDKLLKGSIIHMRRGSAGGVATAKKLRAEAVNGYMANPSTCRECGENIPLPTGAKVAEIRKKKFCNRSCAATYNNGGHRLEAKSKTCTSCGLPFQLWRLANDSWSVAKCCPSCGKGENTLSRRTKGKLFSEARNWQSAASTIRDHARKSYKNAARTEECLICGYEKHTEICHLRGVSEFPNSALISEINAFENLVALCPNHHWELDNGLLKLEVPQTELVWDQSMCL